ncbi:sigma 54 modulation/S30EA ribosomal C-terminal domain-containing protein [Nocardia aurantiaca]|uniref:Sigma 54 modulation/S30EA ribosomal protein C-terminal domain-containing protein n=1 Tax=Nocardia aurantiaca TaxID=2675850 RepID=A0A6I3LA35_9NOCA|nr:sigma 54 modulation/S30EA ribosomal C-terminal domain-containing protein [Nocardia aurantiaca]MTE17285.1 hypothetical protein [Nocardia aurantiaca]
MLRASEAWTSATFPDVVVFAGGRVPMLEGERFAGAVGRQLQRLHVTGGARIRITGPNCDVGPFLVQVNLRLDETSARIQTLTHGRGDALPVVVRLDHHITALRTRWQPRPWPDPARLPLDARASGKVARRKSVPLMTVSPLRAATVMDAMDYDVHIFTDVDTGEDAIVYRAGPSGMCLARQRSVHPPRSDANGSGPFSVNARPAPALTEARAVQQVCERGLPFLFYTDPDTGRGNLLYRRYDADLGLITPGPGDTEAEAP